MPADSAEPDFESGQDILNAVPRGPESVFLHWELSGARSAEVSEAEPCEWVIRAANLSEGSSTSMSVERRSGRCYATVMPGCTYGFELAVRTAGRWRTICRTERVVIPAARPQAPADSGGSQSAGRRERASGSMIPTTQTGVPGLRAETTPLRLGSSPHSPPGSATGD